MIQQKGFWNSDKVGYSDVYKNICIYYTMKKYLNHPEFFSALTQLKPQLVILWFGTNESYSNYTPENFKNDLIQMQSKIKSSISNVSILVITPPLSLLKNHESNTVLNHYSDGIISLMKEYHFAVLPVFEFLKHSVAKIPSASYFLMLNLILLIIFFKHGLIFSL